MCGGICRGFGVCSKWFGQNAKTFGWANSLDTAHLITCSFWTIPPLCLLGCLYLYIHMVCVCVCPYREGIQWEAIDWMDNAECLDLIEKVTPKKVTNGSDRRPPARACWPRRHIVLTLTPISHSIITQSHFAWCVQSNVHQCVVRGMGESKHKDNVVLF